MIGKATLTLRPHFYPGDYVWLNARGMDINKVALLQNNDTIGLTFEYAHDSLKINLNKTYTLSESFQIFIDYVAKPDELKNLGGSAAISSDKGLYFINPEGKEKNKPMQIWTQGETQANSVWFPTIEATNQKMTQEIKITIDSSYTTLSNGLLVQSKKNNDGTRTDTWKQDLPHAPYLVMMAIGKYAIVKDTWKGKEVSYYVEPKYEKVARKIFGNTPEMLTFFSKITGVEYPWAKYNQVVVRDYVSGAMENTTATVHGEFLQQDERELLDGTNEDVISHELFHQWFGDYVTCESWANIALNESFATYGEYLWNEYKYGRDDADIYRLYDLNAYLRESKTKKENLIRFYYEKREDLFDRHSYQKGGTILHILRKHVGDDAFYAALKLYLETNKYKPVEAHQLRIAFEEITGEDLNWFFNQWFYAKGHPILEMNYQYNETTKTASVTIKQTQDLNESPVFRIPVAVDIYKGNEIKRHAIVISKQEETFYFESATKPDLINVDAEKMITGIRNDKHSSEEWMTMYRKGPLFQDRMDALLAITADYKAGSQGAEIVLEALKDKNRRIREVAINKIEAWTNSDRKDEVKKMLMSIGRKDKYAEVREAAISALDNHYKDEDLIPYFKNTISDSSFSVMSSSLQALAERDKDGALLIGSELENSDHEQVYRILGNLYAKHGNDTHFNYMNKALDNSAGVGAYSQLKQFGKFMQRCKDKNNIEKGLKIIHQYGKTEEPWIIRLAAVQSLAEYGNFSFEQATVAAKANDKTSEQNWNAYGEIAAKYLDELKKNEKNEMLLKIYNPKKND
ncbi:MAG: DUF3458 domain-containing protein [Bacteroidetes bacterium]|nr:DUF3458 domain-containing protein [Bacteroidota bacterium]